MATNPVCHIAQNEATVQPSAPTLASIPQASDLSSALSAIAALTQNMNAITDRIGQFQNSNDTAGPGGRVGGAGAAGKAGTPGKAGAAGKDAKPSRWSQTGKVTQKVRVVSTEDSKVFIDVVRTTSITLTDQVTGQTLTITN